MALGHKKSASNGIVWVGLGSLFGVIIDFLYQTNAIPGHNTPLPGCSALKVGDAFQIGGLSAGNVIASFFNNFTFSSLFAGMILGNMAPKLLTIMGKPRYLIYDLGAGGAIKPTLRQPGTVASLARK